SAEMAEKSGEVPIGCVIVRDNEVIAAAGNRTLTDRDPTAHAEMLAIRQAAAKLGSERLVDCDLYVTPEPCPICPAPISLARRPPALFRRRRSQGRRGGFRRALLCLAHLPPCAGGLFRGRRARGGDAAARFLQGEAVRNSSNSFAVTSGFSSVRK